MSDLYKDAPIVKVVMLKGKDGAKSKLSELTNDMTFLTEEQIITLITNIVNTGSVGDIDTGFVTSLVEQNKHKALKFWVGTQAEYDAVQTKIANTFYIITDDRFREDVQTALNSLQAQINNIVQTNYDTEITALQESIQELEESDEEQNTRITALENSLLNNMVYQTGDTVNNERVVTNGYITYGGCELSFTIPLKKFLPSNKKLDFGLALNARIRADKTYILGTADSYGYISLLDILTDWDPKIINRGFYLDVKVYNRNLSGEPVPWASESDNNISVSIQLGLSYTVVNNS